MKRTERQYMDLKDVPFIELMVMRKGSVTIKDYDFVIWIDNELERRDKENGY